jgi:capsular exopolysaccharide synthesis family protein
LLVAQGSTSTESELTNLDLGLNEARQELSNAQARLSAYLDALGQAGPANTTDVVASPMMMQLRTQHSTLVGQKAQMTPTLGPLHPQMVEINRQIFAIEEQMNAEAQRTFEVLKSEVAIADNRVAGLLSIRNQSRLRLAQDNAANVELGQLEANAASLRMLYDDMLTRFKQTSAQETLGQVNAAVVSEAVPPAVPSSPNIRMIAVAAAAVGLALGALAVLLAQLFDNTVVRPEEFERRTQVPLLALVPQMQAGDLTVGGRRIPLVDVVIGKPMSLFAESFRNLRVAVLDAVGSDEPVVLQMTSGTFAEGKTICSIAFARTAALDGKRVLLIDADVRRRCLTQYLGIDVEAGLIELLRGDAELRDVIVPGGANSPHVLPLSAVDAGPHDLFSTKAFENLLQTLKQGFDLIVIDSAPVLAVAEPISLAKRVDAVVLITRWGKTPLDVVLKALREIERVGGNVAGTLLTDVNIKKVSGQSYGRGHYPALLKYYQQ